MYELIAICPSRGRPQAIAELAKTFEETCTAKTKLVAAVDKSDPLADEYSTVHDAVIISDSRTMVEALNFAAKKIISDERCPFALMFLGDDHRPRTPGWDRLYLDELHRLGTGMVYGNDLLQGANIPTQIAMTTDIVRALWYMAPPTFRHLYVDNFWLELGKRLNIITYMPDVIVEHLHPAAGKAVEDEGYRRVNAAEVDAHDREEFHKWLSNGIQSDVKKVERCMR